MIRSAPAALLVCALLCSTAIGQAQAQPAPTARDSFVPGSLFPADDPMLARMGWQTRVRGEWLFGTGSTARLESVFDTMLGGRWFVAYLVQRDSSRSMRIWNLQANRHERWQVVVRRPGDTTEVRSWQYGTGADGALWVETTTERYLGRALDIARPLPKNLRLDSTAIVRRPVQNSVWSSSAAIGLAAYPGARWTTMRTDTLISRSTGRRDSVVVSQDVLSVSRDSLVGTPAGVFTVRVVRRDRGPYGDSDYWVTAAHPRFVVRTRFGARVDPLYEYNIGRARTIALASGTSVAPAQGVVAAQTRTAVPGGARPDRATLPSTSQVSATPAPQRLPPLSPSVANEGAADERRILDAATRNRACSVGFTTLSETHPNRIRSIREVEEKAESSQDTWDYYVVMRVSEDLAEDLERPRTWSDCTRVYAELAQVWRAQAQRVRDHRSGVSASATSYQPAVANSEASAPAPSTASQIGAMLGQAIADRATADNERRRGSAPPARTPTSAPTGRPVSPTPSPAQSPTDRYPAAPDPPPSAPGQVGNDPVEPNRAAGCATFEIEGTSAFIRNRCTNVRILFSWYDEGSCRTGCAGWGMDGLRPGSRETVTRPRGRWVIATCVYPKITHVT